MDSETGRWLSLDPELGKLSMPQTMNRYVFCGNNPLRFADSTGEGFWTKFGDALLEPRRRPLHKRRPRVPLRLLVVGLWRRQGGRP